MAAQVQNNIPQTIDKYKHYLADYAVGMAFGVYAGHLYIRMDQWAHPLKYAIKGAKLPLNPWVAGVAVGVYMLVDALACKYLLKNHQYANRLGEFNPQPIKRLMRIASSVVVVSAAASFLGLIPFEVAIGIIITSMIAKTLLLTLAHMHDQYKLP